MVVAVNEGVVEIRCLVSENIELKQKLLPHIVDIDYWFVKLVFYRMEQHRLNLVSDIAV